MYYKYFLKVLILNNTKEQRTNNKRNDMNVSLILLTNSLYTI